MSSMTYIYHQPVKADEAVGYLLNNISGRYVDATGGGGGHSNLILRKLGSEARLVIIDQDLHAIRRLKERFAGDQRVTIVHLNFRQMIQNKKIFELNPFDGMIFDFGMSSFMIDEHDVRGFSFDRKAPLDMRMNEEQEITAHRVLNSYSVYELHRVLKEYGDLPRAGKVAAHIMKSRPLETTWDLNRCLEDVIPQREWGKSIRLVYQAVRIEVNDELNAIREGLDSSLKMLKPGGRIVTLSFHSLEDKICKSWMSKLSQNCICPQRQPVCTCGGENARLKLLTRGAVKADEEEISRNSRAASVRLRAAEVIK
ncbi:16S rRNA (cytosine(1402)-N(4))-methyltransferase RsmH [bacterium]|nr:16S rRNA (cytosine(1402)-N(4))-methyltransferase RsmH [bacterium]